MSASAYTSTGHPRTERSGGLTEGLPACLTVTLTDGIVLARSAVNHSMNYRSVVVLGTCHPIEESGQRGAALRAFSERMIPGRWAEVRTPSREKLQGTRVLAMNLSECSAKRRNGPPEDDEADYELPVWAGVIPLRTVVGPIITDPRMTGEYEPSAVRYELAPYCPATMSVEGRA